MSVGYVYRRPSPEGLRPNIGKDTKRTRYESERRAERSRPETKFLSEREKVLQRLIARRAGLPERGNIDSLFQGLGNEELPIWKYRDKLMKAVRSNPVTLLEGETGSGKSTQTWQYLIGEGYERVYVLVPRRVIAENLFERAREEMSEQRDESLALDTVGIAHSEHVELSDDNKVVFLTSETFHKLNEKIREGFADKPIAIIGDEIHEANLPTEMAVATAAQQLSEHPKWRLILSSATHDKQLVLDRFKSVNKIDIPVVSIEGRPHDIEFHEKPTKTAAEVYADNYWDHEKTLFFTSGKFEIDEAIDSFRYELERRKRGSADAVVFRKLHAKMSERDRVALNDPVPDGSRLVIVSTPAGMSGMTFPGTTLVLTDGLVKRPELDREGTPGLFKREASQAELIQMIGRGGRDVAGGIGFLCRPFEEDIEFMPLSMREQNAPAEIYNTNISRNVLTAAAYGYDFHETNQFALHQVDKSRILEAYESLYRLQAVDEHNTITRMGQQMNELPLRPELSRSMVEALRRGATKQNIARMAIICSSVEAGGMPYFAHDAGKEWQSLLRPTTADDYIAQLDMYLETRYLDDGVFVDEDKMLAIDIDPKNAYRARKQYHKMMKAMGIRGSEVFEVTPPMTDEEVQIRDYLLAGMVDLVFEKGGRIGQTPTYTSITQGEIDGTPTEKRTSSSRSVLSSSPELVAGWPRRFLKKGVMHQVVEMAMPVDPDVLAMHAAHLTHHETIGIDLKKGRLVEVVQPMFGRLALGETMTVRTSAKLSPKAAEMLRNEVLLNQGAAQRQLRRIAREIEAIYEYLPVDRVTDYLSGRPPLTQKEITEWVKQAVVDSRNVGEVDNRLRQKMYSEGIDLDTWITPENHKKLHEDYPYDIELADGSYQRIMYKDGHPVITGLSPSHAWKLPYDCRLSDGREIMIQMTIGEEKHWLSAEQFRTMATTH